MHLESVAQFLEARRLGRREESIFVTEMPMECRQGILLMDTYSGTAIDHYLPGWRDTGYRLITRGPDYAAAKTLAKRAITALTINGETPMGRGEDLITVRLMLPVNDPKPYRRSDGGYWEFEVDVECIYVIGG